ncbi:hypothetical protein ACLOJK_004039 [Asimina triloba]
MGLTTTVVRKMKLGLNVMAAVIDEKDDEIGISLLSSCFWSAWIYRCDARRKTHRRDLEEDDGAPKLVLRRCTEDAFHHYHEPPCS